MLIKRHILDSIVQGPGRTREKDVYQQRIQDRITVKESCWIAARGSGLDKQTGIKQSTMAHTASRKPVSNFKHEDKL